MGRTTDKSEVLKGKPGVREFAWQEVKAKAELSSVAGVPQHTHTHSLLAKTRTFMGSWLW